MSQVVCAALDFVLSFQVHHVASIFPIDGCDYASYIHKLAIAALLSGVTREAPGPWALEPCLLGGLGSATASGDPWGQTQQDAAPCAWLPGQLSSSRFLL